MDVLTAQIDPSYFFLLGMDILKRAIVPTNDTNLRLFRQSFGVSPIVMVKCWALLVEHGRNTRMKPKHLLWACLFLKTYGKEGTHCALAQCDPKTFRGWVWAVIRAISFVEPLVVSKLVLLLQTKQQSINYWL
jgi:hypothetical protein